MWTLTWWVLSLAAVATFVLVGVSLWRSVRGLLRELARTGRTSERFGVRLAEETAAFDGAHPPVVAQVEDPVTSHRARLASLRAERTVRRARRRAGHEKTYEAWGLFNR